jgi:hypothetical protein
LSPPAREPAIQKVAKYGMKDPYMLYKISCPYFIKVHVYYVLLVGRCYACGDRILKNFILFPSFF